MNVIKIPTKKSLKKLKNLENLENKCDKMGKDWIYPVGKNNKKDTSVLGRGNFGSIYIVCKHKSDDNSKTNNYCNYVLKKQPLVKILKMR